MAVEDCLRVQNVHCYSKWRSKRRPLDYDRPGRKDKAERKYRRCRTHTGKGTTLRSHRRGSYHVQ